MVQLFQNHPGLWFVVATLLPLASFVIVLLWLGTRLVGRRYRETAVGKAVYLALGGDTPVRGPAYVATAAIALACVCSVAGFVQFLQRYPGDEEEIHSLHEKLHALKDQRREIAESATAKRDKNAGDIAATEEKIHEIESHWSGKFTWATVGAGPKDKHVWRPMSALSLGFRIDYLSGLMFVMVTFVATLIHLFSIGYMGDELQTDVEDHQVHTEFGHLHRPGRFGRFFLFLSLFCFSMLNLVLADNLFQVFISWELVGVCSYLLISFYFERQSAGNAANKAFIVNRVGDAGFIIGLLIVWATFGTFNFQEIFAHLRAPNQDSHGPLALAGKIVRADPVAPEELKEDQRPEPGSRVVRITGGANNSNGSEVVLYPLHWPDHYHGPVTGHLYTLQNNPDWTETDASGPDWQTTSMPYWLLVVAGLGLFLGCVGKSAQFPLHVWLPDAMEGPTPVSALIHAATMVAAGVYLVGRMFPMLPLDVLLVIAYIGAITHLFGATVGVVMTDIKKVLAYSTVSQLGLMMLALGIGGWVAGLFHLITHAFFKALLFLGSGSVIYGCHHEQEMTKMGGLYPKMKVTAITMLIGCLAIAGTPLFSGWYSKDAVIATGLGFARVHPHHGLLLLIPLVVAGLTTFYMFRMWFMTFTGRPRDHHVHEHAHESPWVMTVPLVLLGVCSIFVAWGMPPWKAENSWMEHQLHHSQPESVMADFGVLPEAGEAQLWQGGPAMPYEQSERYWAHRLHGVAGLMALGAVLIGVVFAALLYWRRVQVLDPAEAKEQFPWLYNFLWRKWYFDELYGVLLMQPALIVSRWCALFDSRVLDGKKEMGGERVRYVGLVNLVGNFGVWASWVSGLFDRYVVDGLVNLTARVLWGLGAWFRTFQTGFLRSYIVFLVIAAVAIFLVLVYFVRTGLAGF